MREAGIAWSSGSSHRWIFCGGLLSSQLFLVVATLLGQFIDHDVTKVPTNPNAGAMDIPVPKVRGRLLGDGEGEGERRSC